MSLGPKMAAIAKNWIHDPVRPHLQLSTLLESLAKHPNLTTRAVAAAGDLQNNMMFKRYPLSEKILKPASVPHHYERIVEGLEKSTRGIGRPWWKVVLGIWK
ncbi:hypothetical protein C8J56DRAFT_862378 [Mycena floridula]|nr:hypothetical protein C8J56DRAFT_862378 [Mycena floridula]